MGLVFPSPLLSYFQPLEPSLGLDGVAEGPDEGRLKKWVSLCGLYSNQGWHLAEMGSATSSPSLPSSQTAGVVYVVLGWSVLD